MKTLLISILASILTSLVMSAIPLTDDAQCTTDDECAALFGEQPDFLDI